jgi:hypothetical protein
MLQMKSYCHPSITHVHSIVFHTVYIEFVWFGLAAANKIKRNDRFGSSTGLSSYNWVSNCDKTDIHKRLLNEHRTVKLLTQAASILLLIS